MRRLSLSTKLFAAALPLVLAVGALLALTVRNDLSRVAEAERGAELGEIWTPLVTALTSIEAELADVELAATTGDITVDSTAAADRLARITANRRVTDQALSELGEALSTIGSAEAARKHILAGRTSMSAARRAIDVAAMSENMGTQADPIEAYDVALREFVSIGQLLPAEAGDEQLGRELLAIAQLAEARVAADAVAVNMQRWMERPSNAGPLGTAQARFVEVETALSEFSVVAPEEWVSQYRQTGFATQLASYRRELEAAARAAADFGSSDFDVDGFVAMSNSSLSLQQALTGEIVTSSNADADSTRQAALIRAAITLGLVLAAAVIAWLLTRSVTRRVKAVSRRANQVASEQLPALVEALRDPRGRTVLPHIDPVNARGSDELAELAHAFNSMQSTLVDVAQEQVEVLRRGVSDIFVTMARRNRSLIDRQLALLDEFEAEVDDPDVLSKYYQLDHMATRMRRNSESLLVLANAEPKRRRVKATEIDDVVRAAVGEVEDYRRIDIEALESLQVKGNVVADVSHLLAELLDNATSFSPPDSIVRVGGRRAGDSYMIRIVDYGVGIGTARIKELNELLREPPIVGLSVEPTLGMSVVSLLANRHAIAVTIAPGNPGTTVDVLLPSSLFGPIDVPGGMPASPARLAGVERQTDLGTTETGIVDWDTQPVARPEPAVSAAYSIDLDGLRAAAEQPSQATSAAVTAPEPAASPASAESVRAHQADDGDVDFEVRFDTSFDRSFDTGARSQPSSVESFPVQPVAERSTDRDPIAPSLPSRGDDTAPRWSPAMDVPAIDVPTVDAPAAAEAAASPPVSLPAPIPAAPIPAAPIAPESTPEAPVPLAPLTPTGFDGEFSRPPAPPLSTDGMSRRPVTAPDAMPAATVRLPDPIDGLSLPTRTPGRGPDGGPDRLAGVAGPSAGGFPAPSVTPEVSVTATSSPSALQAALSAFDARRSNDSLPTRSGGGFGAPSFDDTPSATQSRLDPEALRERLRAFQNEFRTAAAGGAEPNNPDLGGDRR